MTHAIETDVLIAGGGPCGLMLANDLGPRGIRCLLVDAKPGTAFNPQANATQARTMEHYRRLGFAHEVRALGLPPDRAAAATRAVFDDWRQRDAPAAVAWASARLPAVERARLVESAVDDWAKREPNECGRWLGSLGNDPALDGAVAAFARVIAAKDAASAEAWARRITDPARREAALGSLAAGAGQGE